MPAAAQLHQDVLATSFASQESALGTHEFKFAPQQTTGVAELHVFCPNDKYLCKQACDTRYGRDVALSAPCREAVDGYFNQPDVLRTSIIEQIGSFVNPMNWWPLNGSSLL